MLGMRGGKAELKVSRRTRWAQTLDCRETFNLYETKPRSPLASIGFQFGASEFHEICTSSTELLTPPPHWIASCAISCWRDFGKVALSLESPTPATILSCSTWGPFPPVR